MSLRVERAAVTIDGVVYAAEEGERHHHIIHRLADQWGEAVHPDEQGFTLSDGRFARRKPALRIAIEAGQTTLDKCIAPQHGLFSEDVW